MSRSPYTFLDQAKTLAESIRTLLPEPLIQRAEMDRFYKDSLNEVRGHDIIYDMAYGMELMYGARKYKQMLMGRTGVGKSTELSRLLLLRSVAARYRPIRFSIKNSLDPTSFKPYDVLLLMVVLLVEELARQDKLLDIGLIQPILDWYGKVTVSESESEAFNREIGIGAEVPKKIRELIGLFGIIKGEIKYASETKTQKESYRLSRQDTLLRFVNALFDAENEKLKSETRQEWIFIAEELDKRGINEALPVELLITYGGIWEELSANFILNVPRDLVYSERGSDLPRIGGAPVVIPETPVYTPDHSVNAKTVEAIEEVLFARMSPDLFEPRVARRLVVASGGDLRSLFQMTTDTVTMAGPQGTKITPEHAETAINRTRSRFYGMIGESTVGSRTLTYEEKAQKLLDVYQGKQSTKVSDPILHSLLRVGAVQEFNGKGWLGVHPMVVDILNEQQRFVVGSAAAPGGTTF